MDLLFFTDIATLNQALSESGLKVVDFRGEAITFKVSFSLIDYEA